MLGQGIAEDESGTDSTRNYYPSEQDISDITKETLNVSREKLLIQILEYERYQDEDFMRIEALEKSLNHYKMASKLYTEQLELTKRIYRLKTAKGVLIGGSVGAGATMVVIILVRLAIAGRL